MSINMFSRRVAALCAAFAAMPAFAHDAAGLAPPPGCDIVARAVARDARPAATPPTAAPAVAAIFPPIQLDIRTPLEPTTFKSAGREYLLYELHLQNFSDEALTLRGIDVIDADAAAAGAPASIVAITAAQLKERVRLLGRDGVDDPLRLGAGQGAIAFVCLAFDGVAVPRHLRHRVLLDGAFADGPPIGTRGTVLRVLGPPLAGAAWSADNGPSIASHHRTGVFIAGGMAHNARRYAFDWKQYRDGQTYAGDARDVRAYYAYGGTVLAVADGTVVAARGGMPNNIPRTKEGFTPALPVTLDNIAGNFIVIDIGGGQFAQYAHLQPGSVRVKAGQRVRRGQPLALVGNSGDAREPHLHFQLADAPDFLASEGLPYLLARFRMRDADGQWSVRAREYPLDGAVIDFGPVPAPAKPPR